MVFIASIASEKFPRLNELNDIPYVGSAIIALGSMLPMFVIQEVLQNIMGKSPFFELSFAFFLNNLFFHCFLAIVLDIKIKLFFVSSIFFCLFCAILNGYRQYDTIVSILNL